MYSDLCEFTRCCGAFGGTTHNTTVTVRAFPSIRSTDGFLKMPKRRLTYVKEIEKAIFKSGMVKQLISQNITLLILIILLTIGTVPCHYRYPLTIGQLKTVTAATTMTTVRAPSCSSQHMNSPLNFCAPRNRKK